MIEIWSKPQCIFCDKAVQLCEMKGLEYKKYMIEEDYSRETPETGLSGKGTKERMKVDEKTEELEFWKED